MLQQRSGPFGIRTMLVEPGFFRTELLSNESTTYAQPTIGDYAERTKEIVAAWKSMDGKQGGDPAKLAEALVRPFHCGQRGDVSSIRQRGPP